MSGCRLSEMNLVAACGRARVAMSWHRPSTMRSAASMPISRAVISLAKIAKDIIIAALVVRF